MNRVTVPGLSARPHKYLTAEPTVSESAQGYRIEDGVLVEDLPEKVRLRDSLERLHYPSAQELRAEEQQWAARSGPVYYIERK